MTACQHCRGADKRQQRHHGDNANELRPNRAPVPLKPVGLIRITLNETCQVWDIQRHCGPKAGHGSNGIEEAVTGAGNFAGRGCQNLASGHAALVENEIEEIQHNEEHQRCHNILEFADCADALRSREALDGQKDDNNAQNATIGPGPTRNELNKDHIDGLGTKIGLKPIPEACRDRTNHRRYIAARVSEDRTKVYREI